MSDDELCACLKRDANINEEMGRVVAGQPERMRQAAAELDKYRKLCADMAGHGEFLLARIDELDLSMDPDVFAREWNGHIEPPLARLRAALTAYRDSVG